MERNLTPKRFAGVHDYATTLTPDQKRNLLESNLFGAPIHFTDPFPEESHINDTFTKMMETSGAWLALYNRASRNGLL